MARSPKTEVEPEAVVETTASESDTAATEADGLDSDGTWPIEDESTPAAPEDQNTRPSRTEDSLDTAPAEDQAEVQPAPAGITVTITGPKKGRRRAGRSFGPEPVTVTVSELGEEAMQEILSDPYLTVVVGAEQ